MIASINPYTGATERRFEPLDAAAVESRLDRALHAFAHHRTTTFAERAAKMRKAAELLESSVERWARLMTLEMGKPIQAARDEALKSATGCRYYAEHAERFLATETVDAGAPSASVHYQPLGPVLAIMPWNFPFWQVFRFAAPALMAGNTALLKHASNVPQCAQAIEEIFHRAGFADGVFQTLLIGSESVNSIIADPRVRAVTLTGSVGAGAKVAEQAGKSLKKTVLELGGSDPFIITPSADLDAAVATAVKARLINNGQSCIAAKRFILAGASADEFERRFIERMRAVRMGDPMDPKTELGPMATAAGLQDLTDQVRRSIEAGARVLLGGEPRPPFYPPTILTDIPRNAPAWGDELFGPVASLFRVADVRESIALANDSQFGLGCSVWTNDPEEQAQFVENIEAGMVFINGMVASDARLPFGGVKHSGYGRELSSHGIREFVNIKTVWRAPVSGSPAKGTE